MTVEEAFKAWFAARSGIPLGGEEDRQFKAFRGGWKARKNANHINTENKEMARTADTTPAAPYVGPLRIGISPVDVTGMLHIEFGKNISSFSLKSDLARQFANKIIEHLDAAPQRTPATNMNPGVKLDA